MAQATQGQPTGTAGSTLDTRIREAAQGSQGTQAGQRGETVTTRSTPFIPPGTFASPLPLVEDVLELIYGLAQGDPGVRMEDVVSRAKEINAQLAAMKKAASELPGGQLGADSLTRLTQILDEQAASKRAILARFAQTPTPMADGEAQDDSELASASSSNSPQSNPVKAAGDVNAVV